MKQNASSGRESEAPRRSWGLGHQRHWGPENQASQHIPIQPRVSFPAFPGCWVGDGGFPTPKPSFPDFGCAPLSFLSLFFFWHKARKTPEKEQGSSTLTKTPHNPWKEGKNAQKGKKFLTGRKQENNFTKTCGQNKRDRRG